MSPQDFVKKVVDSYGMTELDGSGARKRFEVDEVGDVAEVRMLFTMEGHRDDEPVYGFRVSVDTYGRGGLTVSAFEALAREIEKAEQLAVRLGDAAEGRLWKSTTSGFEGVE